jgi:hypothetical protein
MPLRLTGADAALDSLMPGELQHLSRLHWTPLTVALHAVAWLAPTPDANVLDIGSGVGKLCLVGALTGAAQWNGVERHGTMVVAARAAARALGVGAATCFVQADVLDVDWDPYSALYLYNPFEDEVGAGRELPYRVQARLASLRPGVRVVCYHGFGAAMPSCYELEHQEEIAGGTLAAWTCRGPRRT